MAEKKLVRRRVKVKKVEKLGFNWFFWISAVLIAIPCIYFVILILSARDNTNVPIIGDRIKNSVIYEITESDVNSIQTEVKSLSDVQGCEVTLKVQTLRISIDASDGLSIDKYKEIAENAYNTVNSKLEISKYFAKQEDYKQYDLEIIVYDSITSSEMTIVSLNKNSGMDTYNVQVLSEPLNPDLAKELQEKAATENAGS